MSVGNWETEHFNSVLKLAVSFLGIQKWERKGGKERE
jgi:hypothetical protein